MAVPTTFEKELHKIFDGIDNLDNKKYVGRAFYASIDNNTKFKAEFISTNSYEHFDALRIRAHRRALPDARQNSAAHHPKTFDRGKHPRVFHQRITHSRHCTSNYALIFLF